MSKRRLARTATLSLVAALAACGGARSDVVIPGVPIMHGPPRNGLEVVGWMRRTYPSFELRSLVLGLRTTQGESDSSAELSRAYFSLPGRMRVDIGPRSARTGYVRDRHRMSSFESGRRVSTSRRVDLAALLVYDVFAQSVDTTIMWLDSARVRFGLARRDRLDGRDVWVVGAMRGDTISEQFWVDARRWVVLRVIQRDVEDPERLSDIRFDRHVDFLDVPVPTLIRVYRGGRMIRRHEVAGFKLNAELPGRTFDLSRWRPVPVELTR